MSNEFLNRSKYNSKVSIIVPFYNAANTLARCLESLVQQSYDNVEIVLIDDGSTDHGASIAQRYVRLDSRIVFISQRNAGQAKARNNGISVATGKLICFVDADDYVHHSFIERMLDARSHSESEIVVCNFMKVISGEQSPEFSISEDATFTTLEALAELNYHRRFDSSAGGKVFPKSYFDKVSFPVGMKCEDAAIMHLLIAQCSRLAYVSEPLYYYERSAGSTTRAKKPNREFVDDALEAIEGRRAFYEKYYPTVMQSMNTESLLSIIYTFGRYVINGGSFSALEMKEMLKKARSYLKDCLGDPNVPKSRKLQSAVFCVSPKIYAKCYVIASSRRGY